MRKAKIEEVICNLISDYEALLENLSDRQYDKIETEKVDYYGSCDPIIALNEVMDLLT